MDGTLLDENYTPGKAFSLIKRIKNRIPIIFCSAKTRKEQEFFLKMLGITHPFIVEDGSAIYIPQGYFKKKVGEEKDEYELIILGVPVDKILADLNDLKRKYKIKGFWDLTPFEISRITGLNLKLAEFAKMREFSETLVEVEEKVIKILKRLYNVVIGGKFYHVFGKSADKGKAVKIVKNLYRKYFSKKIISIGLGNSYTDEPMLREVDIPILVKNPDGKWADVKIENLYKIEGIGPEGWVQGIERLLSRL